MRSIQWMLGICMTLLLGVSVHSLCFQQTVKAEDEEPTRNPYLAREDLTAEELLSYLERMQDRPKTIQSRTPYQAALADAAQRVIESKEKLSEEQFTTAIQLRFRSLYFLASQGDDAFQKQLDALALKYKDDKREDVATEAKMVLLETLVRQTDQTKTEELPKLLEQIKELLGKQKELGERHLELASAAVSIINKIESPIEAGEAYLAFGEMFSKSTHPDLQRYGAKITKFGNKLELLSKPVEIAGTFLDGTELDWKEYKGKVVLIDFWATWCPPCIKEIPNVKANFEKYHEKGFEIIGISLDKEVETVQTFMTEKELPWKTLIGMKEGEKANDHPMVKKFGVKGIPTMILVGRDGKIAAMNARGEQLGPAIEKALNAKPKVKMIDGEEIIKKLQGK